MWVRDNQTSQRISQLHCDVPQQNLIFSIAMFFLFSYITVTEFVGHYGDAEKAPGWVEREREEFARQFDKNKDGKLDREEVRDWALPQRGESLDEAKHLIDGSDDDADGSLSVDEIMVHWELFVGSKATDHGETLRQMDRQEL